MSRPTQGAAIKLHTLIDLHASIPTFIHISDGKMHDVNALDLLTYERGAYYVFDRGYVSAAKATTLFVISQQGSGPLSNMPRDARSDTPISSAISTACCFAQSYQRRGAMQAGNREQLCLQNRGTGIGFRSPVPQSALRSQNP